MGTKATLVNIIPADTMLNMFDYSPEDLEYVIRGGEESEIQARLKHLKYISDEPSRIALDVSRLLLLPIGGDEGPVTFANKTETPYEQWMDDIRTNGKKESLVSLTNWVTVTGIGFQKAALYPIFLYNADYKDTRKIFERLLFHEPSAPPPYLALLMLNMFRQILGLSYSLLAETYSGAFSGVAELHNELFSDASRIEEWLRKKRMGLRYYAGATNTVVGMYDGIFSDASTGATTLNLDADRCLDLGGGFNTSEIERLTGQSFYSADIIAPDMRLSDPDIVLQKNSRNGTRSILRDNEHQAYIKRQSAIGYLPFDVLLDSFPDEAQSYLIISAGFITSTVRPNLTSHQMIPSQELGHVALSIHGVMRVMELVQKGKDVDFFTIQRATRRHYKYKTCLLRWRSGKLTELLTTDDIQEKYTAPQNVPYIYSVIQPSMPEFTSYLR